MVTPADAAWSQYAVTGTVARHDASKQHPNSDYEQPGVLYRKVMSDTDRDHLIKNIVGSLRHAPRDVQERQCELFAKCDAGYGARVREGLSAYWKDSAPRAKL
jgi:catalase